MVYECYNVQSTEVLVPAGVKYDPMWTQQKKKNSRVHGLCEIGQKTQP